MNVQTHMDHELHRARGFMQEKIFAILLKRHQKPIHDDQRSKFFDIVKRLEEALFRHAHNKEEYLNLDTLESRLQNLLRCQPNQSQQYQQLTTSVETPVNSVASTDVNTGTVLPTGNRPSVGVHTGSFNTSDVAGFGKNRGPNSSEK